MATLYFEVEAEWQKVVKLRESIETLERRMSELDSSSKTWKELNNALEKAKKEFRELTDTAAKEYVRREAILMQEVNANKDAVDKIVETNKKKADKLKKIEDEIAHYQELKRTKSSRNTSYYDKRISAKQQEAQDVKKEMAALDEQRAKAYFEYAQSNQKLVSFQGRGNQFGNGMDYDEEFKKLRDNITKAGKDADEQFQNAIKGGNELKSIFGDLTTMATGVAIGNIVSGGMTAGFDKIVQIKDKALQIRSEMQDIESTMTVFLKSEDKANKFVSDLEKAAYYNMFEFADLVSASKEMIAYGIPTDEIIGRIDQLSEVASGTGSSLAQLVSMYDRAKSIGYVDSRTQQTWASQGIVIKDVLAEMGEQANGTKIKFDDLNKVLDYMTKEGGTFYGVMASQLNNISAEEGALDDTLHAMYNEMGKLVEGPYIQTLKFQTMMAENWAQIARVLAGSVVTIGAYRTALVLLNATSAASIKSKSTQILLEKAFAMATKESTLATIMNAQGHVTAAAAMKLYARAALQATAATLTNPYVLAAAAVAALCAGIYMLVTAEDDVEVGTQKAQEAQEAYAESIEQTRSREEELIKVFENSNSLIRDKVKAYNELCDLLPDLQKFMSIEEFFGMDDESRKKYIKDLQKRREDARRIDIIEITKEYNRVDLEDTDYTHKYDKRFSPETNKRLYENYLRVTKAMGAEADIEASEHVRLLQFMQDTYNSQAANLEQERELVGIEEEQGLLQAEKIERAEKDLKIAQQKRDEYRKILEGEKSEAEMAMIAKKAQEDRIIAIKKNIEAQNKLTELRKNNATDSEIIEASNELSDTEKRKKQAKENEKRIKAAIEFAKANASDRSDLTVSFSYEQQGDDPAVQFYHSLDAEVGKMQEKLNRVSVTYNGEEVRKDAENTYKVVTKFQQQLEKDNFQMSDEMRELFSKLSVNVKIGKETKPLLEMIKNPKTLDGVARAAINDALKEVISSTKTSYESFNGTDIDGQKALNKANQRVRQAESIDKEVEKNRRARVDNELKAEELALNAMAEGEDKKNKLREFSYKKAKETANRQLIDDIQSARDASRKRWEEEQKLQDHDGKLRQQWRDEFLKTDTIYQAAKANAYAKEVNALREAKEKYEEISEILKANLSDMDKYNDASAKYIGEYKRLTDYMNGLEEGSEAYARALRTRDQLTKNYIKDSLSGFEDYNSKKRELDEKYAARQLAIDTQLATLRIKLQNATNEEEIKNLRKHIADLDVAREGLAQKNIEDTSKLQKEQMSKDLERLKQDPTYFMAFRDMSVVSSAALDALNSKIIDFSGELSSLNPEDLKAITDLMARIDDELIKRNPEKAIKKINDELVTAREEEKAAEEEYTAAIQKEKDAFLELANAKMAVSLATSYGTPEEIEAANKAQKEAEDRQKKASQDAINARNKYNNAQIRTNSLESQHEKAIDAIKEKIRGIGDLIGQIGNQVGGMVGEIMQDVSSILDDLMKVADLYKQYKDAEALSKAQDNASKTSNIVGDAASAAKDAKGAKEAAAAGKGGSGAGAMATGAAILQGIQLGISVGSKLTSIISKAGFTADAKYEKYAKKIADINKLTKSVNEYAYAALKAKHADDNWFGGSAIQGMQDSWQEASLAQKNYFAKLNERQAAYRNQSRKDGDWLGHVIAGSVTGALIGSIAGPWGAVIGGVIGGAAGAMTSAGQQALTNSQFDKNTKAAKDNLRIETRHRRKSFMGIGGHDQRSQDLVSWAKEKYGADLFDAEGWINVELYNQIKEDFGDKLLGETEKTLDELKELKEKYDEYQEQLKDYVSNLYQPIVNNMVDALWDWLDKGRDALSSFREYAASTFKNIMNDMMQQIVLQRVVGSYQDQIKDLYDSYFQGGMSNESLMKSVAQYTNDMMDRYQQYMPILQDSLESMTQVVQSVTGIDVTGNGSGGGTTGVQASFSQDSIDEANGRMASIQMNQQYQFAAITDIKGDVSSLVESARERNNFIDGLTQQIAQSHLELQGIHSDTTSISRLMGLVGRYMSNWDEHIKTL